MERDLISDFHNQKSGDLNPETGHVYLPEEAEYQKYIKFTKRSEAIDKFGDISTLEKQIKDVLESIEKIELEAEQKNDPQKIELLKNKKVFAKESVSTILDSVVGYAESIISEDMLKDSKDKFDQDNYLKMLENADKYRTIKHDALITKLKSIIRFISFNFGKLDDEVIEQWEEKQEDEGREILKVKRVTFPKNVLCPDSIDLSDRKSIASWALALFEALGKIKDKK
jgi:hypothetical protein